MAFETSRFRLTLERLQWRRGLRAGLAVSTIMVVCHLLGRPTGWAALGAFQVLTVDNGGPYRSRLGNILAVILVGALALFLGTISAVSLPVAIFVTAVFCFAATLARVVSQPLASSSVAIMVCYIVAYGAPLHTLAAADSGVMFYCIGGVWASLFSLILWPVDPFKPARNAVADIYAKLTEIAAALPSIDANFDATSDRSTLYKLIAEIRLRIEIAQNALAQTPARMTARTVRARNLAAMVQAGDLLFARILRVAELGTHDPDADGSERLAELSAWLVAALRPVEPALRERPADHTAAFAPDGSLSVDMHRRAVRIEASADADAARIPDVIGAQLEAQFAVVERDCLLSLEVVYEALRAIWTGAEPRQTQAAALRSSLSMAAIVTPSSPQIWWDALRANLTTQSVMFRHALRLATVTAADVLLLHLIHISHSYWLPMTSIIVLQPYTGETWRKSGDRVGGTVAGAVLAALLAATIPSETGILAVISIGCFLSLAVYAVDYAWYSFFLTPTIVLLTLPQLHDWHFAAVRMGMTGLGAVTALIAMLLFWPEREAVQLPRLLARAAAADAGYLRAMLKFWQCPASDVQARTLAERNILAPARRACGLATNDAEDSLDRALLEHSIPLRGTAAHERLNHDALTFTTYLRRLTQSITALAVAGTQSPQLAAIVDGLATRLDIVSSAMTAPAASTQFFAEPADDAVAGVSLVDQQLARMVRQVGILERAATEITGAIPA